MTALVFALEFEGAVFRSRFDRRLVVDIWTLGAMGTFAVAPFERALRRSKPDVVISAGFGGSLCEEVRVGDLVLGTNVTTPEIGDRLTLGPGWHRGAIWTEAAIIEKAADKVRLGCETGALVGDLETAHIHRLCVAHGIPFVAVRCVSDGVEDDMPVPAPILMNPTNGKYQPAALFAHILKNPRCVAGFKSLVHNAKTAQRRLADGLEEVLPAITLMV